MPVKRKQCAIHGPLGVSVFSDTEWAWPSGGFQSARTVAGDGARRYVHHVGGGLV